MTLHSKQKEISGAGKGIGRTPYWNFFPAKKCIPFAMVWCFLLTEAF